VDPRDFLYFIDRWTIDAFPLLNYLAGTCYTVRVLMSSDLSKTRKCYIWNSSITEYEIALNMKLHEIARISVHLYKIELRKICVPLLNGYLYIIKIHNREYRIELRISCMIQGNSNQQSIVKHGCCCRRISKCTWTLHKHFLLVFLQDVNTNLE